MTATANHDGRNRSLIDRFRAAVAAHSRAHEGQALLWFALTALVMIACVALVTDTGQLWIYRRHLQNAVDAAALAGVQQLPNDTTGARALACDYATVKNGVPGMTVSCGGSDITIYQTYGPNDTIKVVAHRTVTPMLGGLFGWPTITIHAHATALIGSAVSGCIFPLGQTQDLLQASGVWGGSGITLNKATILKNGSNGEPLGLQVYDSSSKSDWRNVVGSALGCDATQDTTATTSPGAYVGPLDKGLEERKAKWEAQGNCPSNDPTVYLQADGTLKNGSVTLTRETCYRIVQIPLLDANSADLGGAATWKIKGFANFYIANWCGQSSTPKVQSNTCPAPSPPFPAGQQLQGGEVWGYYIGLEPAAGGTDYGGYIEGFVKIGVLVD
jgi:hypothetical protein